MTNPVIRAVEVAKRYRTREKTLAGALAESLRRSLAPTENGRGEDGVVWALDGVSFEIGAGEIVGLIGKNGSGKTTLIKVLSRITRPSRGCAEIRGRVGTLIGIGAGFHPELSGRENVFMSGAILGMREREIASQFDEIVAFAEMDAFLEVAVRRYSSGMAARLAFSVGAHLRTDILLIDEALAVGDSDFRRKCVAKLHQLAREGRTILFVGHDPTMMQSLAGNAMLLERGRMLAYGPAEEVMARYQASLGHDALSSDDDSRGVRSRLARFAGRRGRRAR